MFKKLGTHYGALYIIEPRFLLKNNIFNSMQVLKFKDYRKIIRWSPNKQFYLIDVAIQIPCVMFRMIDFKLPCWLIYSKLCYYGDCESIDAADVLQAVLPGDEALYIDEELVPHWLNGLKILLIPEMQDTYTCITCHVIGFVTHCDMMLSWSSLLNIYACVRVYACFILAGKADGEWVRRWN